MNASPMRQSMSQFWAVSRATQWTQDFCEHQKLPGFNLSAEFEEIGTQMLGFTHGPISEIFFPNLTKWSDCDCIHSNYMCSPYDEACNGPHAMAVQEYYYQVPNVPLPPP